MARKMDDTITDLGNRLTIALRRSAELERKLADAEKWITYLASCQAGTVETIELRKSTSQYDKNRHRAILYHCTKAINGKPFEQITFTRESFEWHNNRVVETAALYPYLPSERGEVE